VSLDVLDLSSIKINEAKPRRLSVTTQPLRSAQVGGVGMHPSVPRGFGEVARVAAFGWPGLVIFLTVVA
jgi:hypothetical protein